MKYLHIFIILGMLTLLSSCFHPEEHADIPECTWSENLYQLTPFDLAYSSDFSNDFIMFTGGDINSSINHISNLQYVTKKGDASSNSNLATIVFTQNPNAEECYSTQPGQSWFLISQNDLSQTNPDFMPYGKVYSQSIFATICTNAFSGETGIDIGTDTFVNYKTGQGSYYYLKWSTSQLADASNGTTLSDNIPLTEMATIQYISSPHNNANLIANNDNGYIYIHGNRIDL